MSQYVFDMKLGDSIKVSLDSNSDHTLSNKVTGPRGKLQYKGQGHFQTRQSKESGKFDMKRKVNHIGMICGGTGFAPMLQVIAGLIRTLFDSKFITNPSKSDSLSDQQSKGQN